jgi:hypothetical protein
MSTNVQTLPYGLRSRPSIRLGNSFNVPFMTLTELQFAIKQALGTCESITRFEWDEENFSYIIEYASRPIEETAPPDVLNIIRKKKSAAELTARKASIKFPHNLQHNEILNVDDLDVPDFPRSWSRSILSVFWDLQLKCLCFDFRHFKGDRISSIDLRNLIVSHFSRILEIQYNLKNALVEAGVDIDNTNLRYYLVCDLV